MQCECLSLRSPITALQIVGDFILSGEGASVLLYPLDAAHGHSKKLSCDVLRNYRVHGIEPRDGVSDPTLLAVFGGKGVAVLELNTQGDEPVLRPAGQLYELHDWIWDLRWLQDSNQPATYFALALSHNSVALCDYWARRILRQVNCDEKCILYSARFVGCSWDELVLVAGTVFNQLVLWRMQGPTDSKGRVQTERRISGHSGVIFSIDYMEPSGILASASDDRSIRLWKVGNLRRALEAGGQQTECLLQLYGHRSRVWCVRLLANCVISAGEDSTCLVWSYSGQVTGTFRGHGGSVRALAVSKDQEWLVTGGVDSGIRLWTIGKMKSEDTTITQLHFGQALEARHPKALTSVDTSFVLVMTGSGSIYSCCLATGIWRLLLEDPNYQSYSLLAATRLLNGDVLCAVGNIKGNIKIFPVSKPEEAVEQQEHQGKVHSLSWAWRDGQSPGQGNLFSSGAEGEMVWWEVSSARSQLNWRVKCRYLLPPCRHRWHTSVAFIPDLPYLVCADRRGSILLYSTEEGHPATSAQRPVSVQSGLHGKSGATSVLYHRGLVYSTGRDGCYGQLWLQSGQLGLLRIQRACQGVGWVEQLLPAAGGHLLALGFHGADFVAWILETEQRLLCIACGGGHRSWTFSHSTSGDNLFAYIKSGSVYACWRKPTGGCGKVVKEALHGREITSIRHVGRLEAGTSLLATGSEDTVINILTIDQTTGRLAKLTTISDHISSVRTMAVVGCGLGSSALLFSAGGRAQLQCCRLHLSHEDASLSPRCQVEHLASHRLSEDWERRKNRHRMLKMDPETRLFVIAEGGKKILLLAESFYHQRCVLKLQTFTHQLTFRERRVFLCSAATDGRIALWDISWIIKKAKDENILLNRTHQPWELESPCLVFEAHQCGVNGLDVRPLDMGCYLLASSGDDNAIRVWVVCLREESGICDSHQLVVCSDVQREMPVVELAESRNNGQVDSTGDAGWSRLGVIAGSWSTDDKVALQVLKGPSVESAHAAQVTGLRILSPSLLVSASIDQRLTHWILSSHNLSLMHSKWCQVADIAELESWDGESPGTRLFALCGDGLQILKSWQKDYLGLAPEIGNADDGSQR
ncbi:tRNA (34-2'-O)-methyltransferase regulator WDR6 isoform X2 [Narcine bancroftii]|uniref:tRNA (34-2'-O)-methyltransferase regulator WDR6 isoform X2 n=1 Tax=Narcine bancroftii TaxID=1343680 RepID=UPI003831F05E